jgi:LacI family transcriptional regulator
MATDAPDNLKPAELPTTTTLQDIADRCGVARVTVWRALHHDRKRMSAETYERVHAAARELQYDVSLHQAARALVTRRTGKRVPNQVIGLFFPRFYQDEYFHRIFQAILETLMPQDYGLLSYHAGVHARPLPITIRRGDVDGMIVYETSPSVARELVDRLRAELHFGDRPIVFLMQDVPGYSAILTDDYTGGYTAAAHLLDLGHRHLLWHQIDHPAHDRRLDGYRQACQDRGLNPAAVLHPVVWTSVMQQNRAAQAALLQAHPEITGLLLPNDGEAVYAYHQVQEMGKRVPEEISLIGYDDTDPLRDRRGRNLLTTVRLPLAEVGRQAAQLMLRQITGEAATPQTITLPVEFITRKTTAPPPG